jgi:hypothetical protein
MKSSVARQKARLPIALASSNNGHSSDLHACCVGVRSLSRPNSILARPLCLGSAAWWSSFITNLNNIVPGHAPTAEVEAHIVVGRCCVVAMTLACSLIWPCNSFVLNYCTSSFSVSPSLVRSLWGASWTCAPPVWACWLGSPQPNWPHGARSWPSPWSTWALP